MTKAEFEKELQKYVPPGFSGTFTDWVFRHNLYITLTHERKTKLGDFKVDQRDNILRISINANLNPWSFVITFTHEVAHALVYIKYGRDTKPHGWEWKSVYQELMIPFFEKDLFPQDIALPLLRYLRNPKASSGSDPDLVRALRKYDGKADVITVADIAPGDVFILEGRKFRLDKKRRTRYLCTALDNKRQYLVNGIAIVEKV